jgi:hypothetical protein
MGIQDPRIDTYIEKSAEFAQPILRHIRAMVHQHCSDVSETIKLDGRRQTPKLEI